MLAKPAGLFGALLVLVGTPGAQFTPLTLQAQTADSPKPTVSIVKTVGCVEHDGSTWFLTRATDPTDTELPFASAAEIDEAREATLGSHRFQLVGVAEFLDAEDLLDQQQRTEPTVRESAHSTGELGVDRKVAVKGLHVTGDGPQRINLTSVIALADSCD